MMMTALIKISGTVSVSIFPLDSTSEEERTSHHSADTGNQIDRLGLDACVVITRAKPRLWL
jgi:hypothetical protein